MRSLQRFLVASALVTSVLAAGSLGAAAADATPRVLTADEAILQRPASVTTKTLASTQGCQALLDTGDGDCAVVRAEGGDLIFTVEPLADRDDVVAARPWAARVYAKSKTVTDGWDLVLENPQADVITWANVKAEVQDVTGDGSDDIVFGFRSDGTGGFLDFDVVLPDDADGAVVAAHDRLAKGVAVVKPGRIVEYTAVYRDTDGTCCPSFIERNTIRYRDGEFQVVKSKRIPTKRAHVPPGDLG